MLLKVGKFKLLLIRHLVLRGLEVTHGPLLQTQNQKQHNRNSVRLLGALLTWLREAGWYARHTTSSILKHAVGQPYWRHFLIVRFFRRTAVGVIYAHAIIGMSLCLRPVWGSQTSIRRRKFALHHYLLF